MDGSQQSEGSNPSRTFTPFIDLPPGLIVFSAPPKVHVTRKSQQFKKQRKLVKPQEVDDLSGMLTKMGVKDKEKKKSESGSQPISQVSRDGSARLFQRAQRRLIPKASTVSLLRDYQLSDHTPSKEYAKIWGCRQKKLFENAAQFEKCTGFWRVPFVPLLSTDRLSNNHIITTRHQCISAMKEYSHLSQEEIRCEDYLSGKSYTLTKLYSNDFSPKFHPPVGTETVRLMGQFRNFSTRHKCISAMSEYSENSFEEIRLEQYMPSIAWKDRNKLTLSQKEMLKLPISINSEVHIFLNTSGSTNEAEKGKVRFIGRLPDKPISEIHVGVELDRAVGLGNGCYKDVRLFRTEKLHAEIVPLDSVLPMHLYNGATSSTSTKAKDMACSSLEPTTASEDADAASGSSEANKCSVCWSNHVNMFFQPCGHVCCCERCSKTMKTCPICRTKIIAKHKAYLT